MLHLLSWPQEPGNLSPSRPYKGGLVGAIPNQLGPHPSFLSLSLMHACTHTHSPNRAELQSLGITH